MKSNEPWEDWEAEVARRLGGHRVAASGSTDYAKGDVTAGRYLIDCKFTESAYRLDEGMWGKISSWARNEGFEPIVAVKMDDGVHEMELAVMNEAEYCSLFDTDTSNETPKAGKGFTVNRVGMRQIANWRLVTVPFVKFEEAVVEA
jgi:Holliday junction resolvase